MEKKIYSVVSKIPNSIFEKNNISLLIINDFSNDKTHLEITRIKNDYDYNIDLIMTVPCIIIWTVWFFDIAYEENTIMKDPERIFEKKKRFTK